MKKIVLSWVICVAIGTTGCMHNQNLKKDISDFDPTLPLPKELTISATEDFKYLQKVIDASQIFAQFWNTGDEKYAQEALSDKYFDSNLPQGRPQGKEGPLYASELMRNAFPNLSVEVEEMVISNNKTVLQYYFKGNFTGTFNGHQGEGQSIDFKAIDIYTIDEKGQVVNSWHLEDFFTLFNKMDIVTIQNP